MAAAAAAAAAAKPGAADQGFDATFPEVREAWHSLTTSRFAELRNASYENGEVRHVNTAFKHNYEGMKLFVERSDTQGTKIADDDDTFTTLQTSYAIDAFLISVISRNKYSEEQLRTAKENARKAVRHQASTFEHFTKIDEAIQSARRNRAGGGGNKPVNECEAAQQSKQFSSDGIKFREVGEKWLNTFVQVNNGYQEARNKLSSKLESTGSAQPVEEEDDMIKILNQMLTLSAS
eukprot:5576897-Pyramimonas_sp.AAC.1